MTGGRRVIRTKGRRVEVPEEQRAEIVRLSKRGHSLAKISELTGLSRWTVDKQLKAARGEVAVRRERRSTAAPPAVQPASPSVEVATIPDPVVSEDQVLAVDKIATLPELASHISAAYDQAKAVSSTMESITAELQELWERAERIAQMEESLTGALTVFRQMKDQLAVYKNRLDEAEQANLQRAVVVHSETGSYRE